MRTNKLGLAAALVIGGLLACGSLVNAQTATNNAPATPGKHGPRSVDSMVDHMSTQLSLTDEQKPKVKAVLENTQKQMHDLHADTSLSQQDRTDKRHSIMEEQNTKMKAILTPDQYEKYQQMTKKGGKKGQKKASPSTNAPTSNQ